MEAFFKTEPADAPAPTLEAVVGQWTVTPDSCQILAGQAGEPVGSGGISFSFRILQEGGATLLRWEGPDRPARKLSLKSGRIVAQGQEGSRDLVLALVDGRLLGTMEIEKPVKGRMEFHASRGR